MTTGRRSIRWSLSKAAQRLPRRDREAFREFLYSLDAGEDRPRKKHSWKRKRRSRGRAIKVKPKKVATVVDAQLDLPL